MYLLLHTLQLYLFTYHLFNTFFKPLSHMSLFLTSNWWHKGVLQLEPPVLSTLIPFTPHSFLSHMGPKHSYLAAHSLSTVHEKNMKMSHSKIHHATTVTNTLLTVDCCAKLGWSCATKYWRNKLFNCSPIIILNIP